MTTDTDELVALALEVAEKLDMAAGSRMAGLAAGLYVFLKTKGSKMFAALSA